MNWLSTSGIVVALAVIMLLLVVPRGLRRASAGKPRRPQLASVGRTAEDIFASAQVLFSADDADRPTGAAVPSASTGAGSASFSSAHGGVGKSLPVLTDAQYARTSVAGDAPAAEDQMSDGADFEDAPVSSDSMVSAPARRGLAEADEAYEQWKVTANSQPSSSWEEQSHSHLQGKTQPTQDTDSTPSMTEIRGPAPTEMAFTGEVPVVEQTLFGGTTPAGLKVHPVRAIILGAACVGLLVTLVTGLLAVFGMLPWSWPVLALIVTLLVAGLLRYQAMRHGKTGASAPQSSGLGTQSKVTSAPLPQLVEAADSENHMSRQDHREHSQEAEPDYSVEPAHLADTCSGVHDEQPGTAQLRRRRRYSEQLQDEHQSGEQSRYEQVTPVRRNRAAATPTETAETYRGEQQARVAASRSADRPAETRQQTRSARVHGDESRQVAAPQTGQQSIRTRQWARTHTDHVPDSTPQTDTAHTPAEERESTQEQLLDVEARRRVRRLRSGQHGLHEQQSKRGQQGQAGLSGSEERTTSRAQTGRVRTREGGVGGSSQLPAHLAPLAPRQEPMFFDAQADDNTAQRHGGVAGAPVAPTRRSRRQEPPAQQAQNLSSQGLSEQRPIPQSHMVENHAAAAENLQAIAPMPAGTLAPASQATGESFATGATAAVDAATLESARQAQAARNAQAAADARREAQNRQVRQAGKNLPTDLGDSSGARTAYSSLSQEPLPANVDESDLDALADDIAPVYEPGQDPLGTPRGAEDTSTQSVRMIPGTPAFRAATKNTWEPVQLPKPLHTLHQKDANDKKNTKEDNA